MTAILCNPAASIVESVSVLCENRTKHVCYFNVSNFFCEYHWIFLMYYFKIQNEIMSRNKLKRLISNIKFK